MTEPYVELHASSAFSFLDAASLPESLIERAAELEMPAIALLDRNGFYGSARFHTLGRKTNIRAHVGAEISVKDFGPRRTPPQWLPHRYIVRAGAPAALVCLAHRISEPVPDDHSVQDARSGEMPKALRPSTILNNFPADSSASLEAMKVRSLPHSRKVETRRESKSSNG